MNSKKRNRFWQLHSLLGITLGLPLFVIFVAGTLAFFEPHALNWLQPQFDRLSAEKKALNPAIDQLLQQHPETDEISVVFASEARPVTDIYLEANHEATHYWLDPVTHEATRATEHEADIFHFFVDLHYFEFIPYGREATGVIAALFFTIILTGVVYQWRRMKQDAHPKNLSLQNKNRWKNIHRFTSLFTLPFQIVYSATGAALALGLLLAAPAIYLYFDGKSEALNEALFPGQVITAAPVSETPQFPIDEAISVARSEWPAEVTPLLMQIHYHEKSEAAPASNTIILHGKENGTHFVGTHLLTLDGDLNVIHDQTPISHLGPMMIEGLVNLHFASFNNLVIKIIFILAGLIVSLSIAAGVFIFLQRRLQNVTQKTRSTKILTILTHWCLGGLPLSIALSLHTAQFAPDFPLHVFSAVMAVTFITSIIVKKPLACYSLLSAAAFIALPITFAITHKQWPIQFGSEHATMVTLFNLFFVLTAAGIYGLKVSLKTLGTAEESSA
ncbi:PepSY domain-containing protein [Verrucomicrobiaceae bacterium R5-34]|nr:PepSY domain-containing protein [Verrucomicrobiaceae bacterium R5-34]